MQCRRSLAGKRSSLSIPSRGTVRAFSVPRCGKLHSRGCAFRHCSASLASPASHLVRPLLTSPRYSAPIARHPAPILRSTGETSRGKTRSCRCIDAGFTKCISTAADGGLRSYVPARPRCITPHIRFLFVAPQLWVRLPSDLTSQ